MMASSSSVAPLLTTTIAVTASIQRGSGRLVDQVFFDPDVPGQKVCDEQLREVRLVMKSGHHRSFCYDSYYTIFQRSSCCDA
jgi:hypothetical protein